MDTVELLYRHYEDSVSQLKSIQKERDRFFAILGILLACLFILDTSPGSTITTVQQIAKNQWGIETALSFSFIQSLIWFLLLYYTIRYCQRNIYSERLTSYIQRLENEITSRANIPFSREGGDYISGYPKVLDFIHLFYTVLFPICYILLTIRKIKNELLSSVPVVDVCAVSLNIVIIFLYFCFLHKTTIKTFSSKFRIHK